MSSRHALIRDSQMAQTVVVHLDGRVQQSASLPPSTPEAIVETEDAATLVEEAHRRADELIAQANEELAEFRTAGYQVGHDAGYRDGVAAGRATVAEALALVQAAGRAAHEARERIVANAERDIVELVIAALRAVVGEQVQADPTLVMQTVTRAMEHLGAQNALRVRVHPDQATAVSAVLSTRDDASTGAWEVLGDGSVSVGGCIIDTSAGQIDARLDVQLDVVAAVLRSAAPDAA